jgi:hypothetical protein
LGQVLIKIKGRWDEMPTILSMAEDIVAEIFCPHCDAGYKVIRVKAEPGKTYRPIRCKACRGPLAATDGDDLLKYFLVRRPRNYNWAVYYTQHTPPRLVGFVDNEPNELAAVARAIRDYKIPLHERDGLAARRRD